MKAAVVCIVMLAAISGCADEPTAGALSTTSGQGPSSLAAWFGRDTGAIQGSVTDDALVPLAGARVLLDGSSETTTDGSGGFVFSDVETGDHVVAASLTGFAATELHVAVAAESVVDAHVVLMPLPSEDAYVETIVRDAVLSCAFMYQGPAPEPLNSAQMGCNWVTILAGPNPLDADMTRFVLTGFEDVTGVWVETTWQASQTFGKEVDVLWLIQVVAGGATNGISIASAFGTSPAATHANRTHIDARAATHAGAACKPDECVLVAYHAAYSETEGLTLLVDQRLRDFVSVFHNGPLPTDYTAIPDY